VVDAPVRPHSLTVPKFRPAECHLTLIKYGTKLVLCIIVAVFLQSTWKLALIFLLCDAYIKWDNVEGRRGRQYHDDHIFYAALEWDIYNIFVVSVLGKQQRFCY